MAVERWESEQLETLKSILSQLDITISALRDALQGAGVKSLTDLDTQLQGVNDKLNNSSSWSHGYITVTTAGTPVQGPDVAIPAGKAVVLIYHPDNTSQVGIGNSSANALLPANGGSGAPIVLSGPGQSVRLYITNLNLVWIDAATSGDKVMWIVEG